MNRTLESLAAEGLPTLQIEGPVATLRLQRPSRRNSLGDDDLQALLRHFEHINADPAVRVVVLSANTRAQARPVFCAGYHVGGFDGADHDPQLFSRIPDALERLRPITVCALNGSVYGGATDLVLACDLRVGLVDTEWRMPAVALGLHIYPGALRRYISRLGLNASKRAFLTAQAMPMARLEALGLFETLTDAQGFDAAVDRIVQTVLSLAPLAAQTTKQSLNELAAHAADAQILREREDQTAASADFAEGRTAFAERRAPRFSGR